MVVLEITAQADDDIVDELRFAYWSSNVAQSVVDYADFGGLNH